MLSSNQLLFGQEGHTYRVSLDVPVKRSAALMLSALMQVVSRYVVMDEFDYLYVGATDDVWHLTRHRFGGGESEALVLDSATTVGELVAKARTLLDNSMSGDGIAPLLISLLDEPSTDTLLQGIGSFAVLCLVHGEDPQHCIAMKTHFVAAQVLGDIGECVEGILNTGQRLVPTPRQLKWLVNHPGYGGELPVEDFAPMHARFFRQAAKTPDRVAIVDGCRQLSYHDLASKARSVAAYLLQSISDKSERVGVYLDRSLEASCAMIGILSAGLVYVPLDVRSPQQRMNHIVRSSNITRVVTSAEHGNFIERCGMEVVSVDAALSFEGNEAYCSAEVQPADEAYVIYTSGTTGKPKGVVVQHAQFEKQIRGWHRLGYDYVDIRTALIASYGFDSCFLEHFLTLNNGGCLYVFGNEHILDTESLARTIDEYQIQFAILSPALLSGTVSLYELTGRPLPLTLLVSGGEPVPNDELLRFQALKPELNICVGYGTTEATIAATTHHFDAANARSRYSPIGRPMPGYHILLLDEQLQPVPYGVTGQICITGDVLAKGYDSNPDETHKRFRANPFFSDIDHDDRWGIMYLTGDLAKFDADGNLVFQGRIDNQVQVRGLRVELGEVESAVKKAFDSDVYCCVWERSAADKAIVAYIVAESASVCGESVEKIKALLPEYMLPSYIVPVAELPVNVNDKIDKSKLPSPTAQHLLAAYKQNDADLLDSAATTDEMERDIIELAKRVLGLEFIRPNDLFIDLGADSLRIVKLVIETQKAFEVRLPVRKMQAIMLSPRSLCDFVKACSEKLGSA